MGGKRITQVTVKMNPEDEVSRNFFSRIENRDREIYPTIFSYLNAAVGALEMSEDESREYPILTEADLNMIGLTLLDTLRQYETKKKKERMLP